MDELTTARQDRETRIVVFTRWTPVWIEEYVVREDGSRELLQLSRNPYGMVPWVELKDPEWLRIEK